MRALPLVLFLAAAPCFGQTPAVEMTLERALLDAAREGNVALVIEEEVLPALRAKRLVVQQGSASAQSRFAALLSLVDLPHEATKDPRGATTLVIRARPRAAAPPAPATPAARIGVVDMSKAFQAHPRREGHEAALNARQAQLKQALEAAAEAIRGHRGRLDGIDRQTDAAAWERLKAEIVEAQQALESRTEAAQRELRSLVESDTRELLVDIERAVAEVARRDRLALVLWREELAQTRQVGRDGPVVLFADATLDVTPAVIAILSAPAAAPAPAAPEQRREY